MKRTLALASVLILATVLYGMTKTDNTLASSSRQISPDISTFSERGTMFENLGPATTVFTKNIGQWDESVKFRADAGGAVIWFTTDGIYYQFTRRVDSEEKFGDPPLAVGPVDQVSRDHDAELERADREVCRTQFEQLIVKASFVGANHSATVSGKDMTEYRCNYFIGDDQSRWATNVPNYSSIVIEDLYPGIDIRFSGESGQMNYEFIADDKADLSQVKFEFDGVDDIGVDEDGRMLAETDWGSIIAEINPTNDGTGSTGVMLLTERSVGLNLSGEKSGGSRAVVAIDFSTYLGGSSHDGGNDVDVDASGNIYVTGWTASVDFPVVGEYQTSQGNTDVFVTKLSGSGESPIYSTFLGGSTGDNGYGIAVDGSGAAIVAGQTTSSDFPTVNEYQTDQPDFDGFVTKLSATGDDLVFSTYLGGEDSEICEGVAVDNSGSVYVTGGTYSTGFPVLNSYQSDQGNRDCFVTKFSDLGVVSYSTYLGGSADDAGHAIDLDGSGFAYVTGLTGSVDFPTVGSYQTDQPGNDAFVTKLSTSGSSLVYSTYIGGDGADLGKSIVVNTSGQAYTSGETGSTDFPTVDPYQTHQGNDDAYICKLNSSGDALEFSTYIGGTNKEYVGGIDVDSDGDVYLVGYTYSTDFPTVDPYQTDGTDIDVYVSQLSSAGNDLIFSTYLSGNDGDYCSAAAIDGADAAVVVGYTDSDDFPALNAYQTFQGSRDAFIVKFNEERVCGDLSGDQTVNVTDEVALISYMWQGGVAPVTQLDGDLDGIPGINNNDQVYVNAYIFHGGDPPQCAPFPDYVIPTAGDEVTVTRTTADAAATNWYCDIYITMNTDLVDGISLPFSFSCSNSSIVCDSISFVHSIYNSYSDLNSLIDTAEQKAVIGIPHWLSTEPPADTGQIAKVWFSLDATATDKRIVIDTTTYPYGDEGEEHITILSKVVGPEVYAYVPELSGFGPDPWVVTNLNDDGPGSLRYVMNYADTSSKADTIRFDVSGVIEPQTALPEINSTEFIEIVGADAPGGLYSVIIDGSSVPSGPGFSIVGSSGNSISGITIRNFPGAGVVVDGATAFNNCIRNNLIYDNGGLAIDLGNDGVTENDVDDLDTGPNHLLNYPDIDSMVMNSDSTFTIYGNTNWGAMGSFAVQFYVAYRAADPTHIEDPSGHGEAYEFIGSATPSGLDLLFEFTVPNTVPLFSVVSATVTEVGGGRGTNETSEFGENIVLTPGPLVVYGYSPINLMITDPNGDQFGKLGDETFIQEIESADYFEEPDIDSVVIHHPIEGTYHIDVYGTVDAQPGDTYTMGTRIDGSTQCVLVVDDDVPLLGTGPDEYEYEVEEDWHYENGDANHSGGVDIDDVVFMIAYIFSGGPIPDPPGAGDANCSLELDIDDVVYLIAYIFSGGDEPCSFDE